MKNPLMKAFGLALLNMSAYLLLRIDELFVNIFSVPARLSIEATGSHFIFLGLMGMFMIILAALAAGRISIFSLLPFHNRLTKKVG